LEFFASPKLASFETRIIDLSEILYYETKMKNQYFWKKEGG